MNKLKNILIVILSGCLMLCVNGIRVNKKIIEENHLEDLFYGDD